MVLLNICLVVGIILIVIGGFSIIRFDGSIKRVVLSLIAIVAGATLVLGANAKKSSLPVEYEISQIEQISTDGSSYRVALKAKDTATVLYVDGIEVKDFEGKDSITLTKSEIENYKD